MKMTATRVSRNAGGCSDETDWRRTIRGHAALLLGGGNRFSTRRSTHPTPATRSRAWHHQSHSSLQLTGAPGHTNVQANSKFASWLPVATLRRDDGTAAFVRHHGHSNRPAGFYRRAAMKMTPTGTARRRGLGGPQNTLSRERRFHRLHGQELRR